MKNSVVFFLSMILCFGFNSCRKQEPAQDVYYIKYEVKSNSLPYYGVKLDLEYKNEKGSIVKMQVPTGIWETTIGPISKGKDVSLSAIKTNWGGEPEYHLKMELHIYQSLNNSPFAIKASNSTLTPRAQASVSYILD